MTGTGRKSCSTLNPPSRNGKKTLTANPGLEDGQRAELETCLRDEVADLVRRGRSPEEAFRQVTTEMGKADDIGYEFFKVYAKRRFGPPSWKHTGFSPALLWNYLVIALRKIRHEKVYSVINIVGLALGLACCALTVIWAQYEYSFDGFHRNADFIYRVMSENPSSRQAGPVWGAPPSLGPALAAEYPEVVRFSRYQNLPRRDAIQSDLLFSPMTQVCYVDPAFFTVFDFPFLEGDPETALQDPLSVVLTAQAARRFFGDERALGKILQAFRPAKLMTVTGILKDIPENSHIQFDIAVPFGALKSENWTDVTYDLYLQVKEGTSIREFGPKIQACLLRHDPQTTLRASLQPLEDIHFEPPFDSAWWRSPEKKWIAGQINLFLLVSLAVLAIAGFNSVNLAMARSLKQFKATGVRKICGASRLDIIRQSLAESMMAAFLATAAALVLAGLLLPLLGDLTGRRLDLRLLNRGHLGFSLLGLTLAVGFLSGFYPALFTSSFRPLRAVRKAVGKGRLSLLLPRRVLVCVQFLCSTVLILVTAVFLLQMDYTNKRDLGYRRKNLVVVPGIPGENADAYKNTLLKDPRILNVTFSETPTMTAEGHRFDASGIRWEGQSPEQRISFDLMGADEDFPETYGIAMAAGRFFSRGIPQDTNNVVLNESAVRAMGLRDPVGKTIELTGGRPGKGRVIGVIKDYHTSSLRAPLMPLVILYFKGALSGTATIRISGDDGGSALRAIEAAYKDFQPNRPFSFTYLEDGLASLYLDDRAVGRVIAWYGLIALAIAGLGLVGLIALVTEQRTKEIAVRKVLGASTGSVVHLISREFLLLVGVAGLFAWPVGYVFAANWLKEFAYRIRLSP